MSGSAPLLEIRREHLVQAEVVRLEGEVDLSNASVLQDALGDAAGTAVVLDLGGLRYLDSAGLRAIERSFRALAADGRTLRLVAPPETPASWVLRVVGFGEAVHVSLEDALAALGRSVPS